MSCFDKFFFGDVRGRRDPGRTRFVCECREVDVRGDWDRDRDRRPGRCGCGCDRRSPAQDYNRRCRGFY